MSRTLVRYKKGNEHFEAEIDYDLFPDGDYLLTDIYTDISQGLRPSNQELQTVFNTTVAGSVIDATVKTISDLGSLGDEVLARLEVVKIDLKKQYPY